MFIVRNYGYNYSLKEAFNMELMTQFFNGITPFSSGGQPVQIYMLHKQGISIATGTNIILMNFIFYQAALVLIGLICVFINWRYNFFTYDNILTYLLILGFIINTLVMLGLLVIGYATRFTNKFSHVLIKILRKMNIVKDEEETIKSVDSKVEEFRKGTNYIRKHKLSSFVSFFIHFIGLIVFYLIPLFCFYSVNDFSSIDTYKSLTSCAYTLIIGAFVPIPGGTGGIEYAYIELFKKFANVSIVNATLLIWRIITYYSPIIIGAIVFNTYKIDKIKKED